MIKEGNGTRKGWGRGGELAKSVSSWLIREIKFPRRRKVEWGQSDGWK